MPCKDADKFVKMVEVYVRGNSIKYVTIPDEVLDMVQEEDLSKESELMSRGNRAESFLAICHERAKVPTMSVAL